MGQRGSSQQLHNSEKEHLSEYSPSDRMKFQPFSYSRKNADIHRLNYIEKCDSTSSTSIMTSVKVYLDKSCSKHIEIEWDKKKAHTITTGWLLSEALRSISKNFPEEFEGKDQIVAL